MEKFKDFIKVLWKRKFFILGLALGIQGFINLFKGDSNYLFQLLVSIMCFQQDDIVDLKDEINNYYIFFSKHQDADLASLQKLVDIISTKNNEKEEDK